MSEDTDFLTSVEQRLLLQSQEIKMPRLNTEETFFAFDRPECKFSEDAVKVEKCCGFLLQIAAIDTCLISANNPELQRAIEKKKTEYGTTKRNYRKYSVLGNRFAKSNRFQDGENNALVISQAFDADTRLAGDAEITRKIIKVVRPLFKENVTLNNSPEDFPPDIEPITNFYDTIRNKRLNPNRQAVRGNFPSKSHEDLNKMSEIYTLLANSLAAAWANIRGIPVIYHGINFEDNDSWLDYSGNDIRHTISHKLSHNLMVKRFFPEITSGYAPITNQLRNVVDTINGTQIAHAAEGLNPPFEENDIQEIVSYLR